MVKCDTASQTNWLAEIVQKSVKTRRSVNGGNIISWSTTITNTHIVILIVSIWKISMFEWRCNDNNYFLIPYYNVKILLYLKLLLFYSLNAKLLMHKTNYFLHIHSYIVLSHFIHKINAIFVKKRNREYEWFGYFSNCQISLVT